MWPTIVFNLVIYLFIEVAFCRKCRGNFTEVSSLYRRILVRAFTPYVALYRD